jgi:uncharacterized LabA/DUF88 family protein
MKRTVILIDGQNLYYNLKNIGLIEKNIRWDELFKSILPPNDELIRTYWFRPQKILDTYFTARNVENQIVYKKYRQQYESYIRNKESINPEIKNQIDKDVSCALEWLKKEKERFAQIEYSYDQICLEYNDIEIIKTGIVKVDPYCGQYIGEKGVDIAVAVKMIALSVENKCDSIILMSGDYDYVEAIRFAKNNMTKISIVKIHKGYPPKNKSVSRDLAILADRVIDLYESEIKSKFLKENVK